MNPDEVIRLLLVGACFSCSVAFAASLGVGPGPILGLTGTSVALGMCIARWGVKR